MLAYQFRNDRPAVQDRSVLLDDEHGGLGHAVLVLPNLHLADGDVRNIPLLQLFDEHVRGVYDSRAGVSRRLLHFGEVLRDLRRDDDRLPSSVVYRLLDGLERFDVRDAEGAPVSAVDCRLVSPLCRTENGKLSSRGGRVIAHLFRRRTWNPPTVCRNLPLDPQTWLLFR